MDLTRTIPLTPLESSFCARFLSDIKSASSDNDRDKIIALLGEKTIKGLDHRGLTSRAITQIVKGLSSGDTVVQSCIIPIKKILLHALLKKMGIGTSAILRTIRNCHNDPKEEGDLLQLLAQEVPSWLSNQLECSIDTIPFKALCSIVNEISPLEKRVLFTKSLLSRFPELKKSFIDHFKEFGWIEEIQRYGLFDDRLKRATLIADCDPLFATKLLDFFGLFSFVFSKNLKENSKYVMKLATERWSSSWIITHFEEINLEGWTFDERLRLVTQLVKHGHLNEIADQFDSFFGRREIATLLVFADELIKSGQGDEVARYFQQLGLSQVPIEERLNLIERIIKGGGAITIARQLDESFLLGFTTEQGLHVADMLIKSGFLAASEIIHHIALFQLSEATIEQRFDLMMELASYGGSMATRLISHTDQFMIEELPSEKRAMVAKRIALSRSRLLDQSSPYSGALIVMNHHDKLRLTIEELQRVAQTIVDHHDFKTADGKELREAVIEHFEQLKLGSEEKIKLCETIIYKGDEALKSFLHHAKKLNLLSDQRFNLAMKIVKLHGSFVLREDVELFEQFINPPENPPCSEEQNMEITLAIILHALRNGFYRREEPILHYLKKLSGSISSTKQRVELIVKIAKATSAQAFMPFIGEFGFFELPCNERYEVMKMIIKDLSWSNFFVNNGSNLRPEEWTLEQRKELAKILPFHSSHQEFAFFKLLLGADHGERIEIISLRLKQLNGESARHQFAKKILEEELDLREAPFQRKIELLELISSHANHNVHSLISCKNLGLTKAIARFESVEERLKWTNLVVNLYEGAAIECIHHFDELKIEEASSEERLALLQLIEKRGKVASAIVGTFSKDTLVRATVEEIIAFIKTIVVHDENLHLFMRWFDAFGLDGATEEQIVDLASCIAVQDLLKGIDIAEKRLPLSFSGDFISMEAMKKIAMKSDIAAALVVKHCSSECLSRLSADQLTDFLRFLVERGPLAEEALVHYYEKLQFSRIAMDEITHLVSIMVNNSHKTAIKFIDCLVKKEPRFFTISIDRRLHLVDAILQKSTIDSPPHIVNTIWNFQDFISLDSSKKRLNLAMVLAQLSPQNAEKLVTGFDQIRIQEATDSEKVRLTALFASRLRRAVRFERGSLTLKLQFFLELMAPPFDLDQFDKTTIKDQLTEIDGGSIALLFHQCMDSQIAIGMEDFFKKLKRIPKLQEISELLKQEVINQLNKVQDDSKKERIKQLQLPWCAYAATVIYGMKAEEIDLLKRSNLLSRIMEFRSPFLRYPLMRQLSFLVAEEPALIAQRVDQRVDDGQIHRTMAWILTSMLPSLGISKDVSSDFFNHYCKHSSFKKSDRAEALCSFLLALLSSGPKDEREIRLLSHALKEIAFQTKELTSELGKKKKPANQKELQARLDHLLEDRPSLLHNLLTNFGRAVFYASLASPMNLQDYFASKFTDLFQGSKEIDNLATKYQRTFGTFRDPKALYTYLGSLKQVSKESGAVEALNHYVVSVLEGEFPAMRYATEDHPHLEKLFSQHGVRENWLAADADMKLDFSEEHSHDQKDHAFKEFFFQKIVTDRHIDPKKHPFLAAFLNGDVGDHLTALLMKIASERALYVSEENQEKKRELAHQLQRMNLEQEIILLSLAKPKEQKSAFATFLEKIQGMNLGPLLQNDIKELTIKLQPPQKIGQLTIEESDQPCDLLLLGTEIHGSCQKVGGNSSLNRGLLGYLLHGEIRPIVIKDGSGRMIARSIMRLLWDGKRPLILLERIYDNLGHAKIKEAILKWAVDKATKMAIPLVSKEVGSGTIYPEEVQFLGGRAPFIYSDAFSTVLPGNQEASLGGLHTLYSPGPLDRR